jgi:hypothetical protein
MSARQASARYRRGCPGARLIVGDRILSRLLFLEAGGWVAIFWWLVVPLALFGPDKGAHWTLLAGAAVGPSVAALVIALFPILASWGGMLRLLFLLLAPLLLWEAWQAHPDIQDLAVPLRSQDVTVVAWRTHPIRRGVLPSLLREERELVFARFARHPGPAAPLGTYRATLRGSTGRVVEFSFVTAAN